MRSMPAPSCLQRRSAKPRPDSNLREGQMADQRTVWNRLHSGREQDIAIAAPGRPALSYGELRRRVTQIMASLNSLGIGRNDRVGIVLPNGPEMACAFLGVAAGATAAPLNPAYTEDEFAFYLSDLGAKALIVESGSISPAIASARKFGIAVIAFETLQDASAGTAYA